MSNHNLSLVIEFFRQSKFCLHSYQKFDSPVVVITLVPKILVITTDMSQNFTHIDPRKRLFYDVFIDVPSESKTHMFLTAFLS